MLSGSVGSSSSSTHTDSSVSVTGSMPAVLLRAVDSNGFVDCAGEIDKRVLDKKDHAAYDTIETKNAQAVRTLKSSISWRIRDNTFMAIDH